MKYKFAKWRPYIVFLACRRITNLMLKITEENKIIVFFKRLTIISMALKWLYTVLSTILFGSLF